MTTTSDSESNVDRGWAVPLLLASFLTMALMFGVSFSSAIFYVAFLEAFNRSGADTAWAVSLNSCATYFCQPIASYLSVRLGSAWVVTLGCLLSSLGLMCSTFTDNLESLSLTFGLLAGLGWSLCMVGTFHGIFLFFQSYRKLAIALTTLGISAGQFLYPPMLKLLFSYYNWKGSILILSALNLNILLVAAILIVGRARHLKTLENDRSMNASYVSVSTNGSTSPAPRKTHLEDLKAVLRLFVDRYCFLLNVSTLMTAVAVGAFQTHITRAALTAGHTSFLSAMLPAAIGAAGIAGRIGWGLLTHYCPRLNIIWMTVASYGGLIVVGIICIFWRTFAGLLISCIIFGCLIGVWALLPEVIALVAGIERVVHALGLNGLFAGLGLLSGPPFLSWLSDADPFYRLSFGMTSIFFFVSLLLLLPSALRKGNAE